jgi:hypothetical protein
MSLERRAKRARRGTLADLRRFLYFGWSNPLAVCRMSSICSSLTANSRKPSSRKDFPRKGRTKIIQAGFDLPQPQTADLNLELLHQIDALCGSPGEEQLQLFMNIFYDVIAPEIRTPRDLIRLMNAMSVTWAAVGMRSIAPTLSPLKRCGFFVVKSIARFGLTRLSSAAWANAVTVMGAAKQAKLTRCC